MIAKIYARHITMNPPNKSMEDVPEQFKEAVIQEILLIDPDFFKEKYDGE